MPCKRAVDGLDRIAPSEVRIVAHPGLVELDHVGAGLLQIERFGVDGGGERHRQFLVVLVVLVLGLLAHRERSGQGDLGRAVGILAQKFHVVQFDRPGSLHFANDARHRRLVSGARRDDSGLFVVDAFERRRKAVGVALTTNFAVGYDIDAGALHVPDSDDGGIVLRLFEMFGRQPPHRMQARTRHHLRQHGAIHQPFRLRVAADHGGRQQVLWQVHDRLLVLLVVACSASGRARRSGRNLVLYGIAKHADA